KNNFRVTKFVFLSLLTNHKTNGTHDVSKFLILENFFNGSLRNVHWLTFKCNPTLIEFVTGRSKTSNSRIPFTDEKRALGAVFSLVSIKQFFHSLAFAFFGQF